MTLRDLTPRQLYNLRRRCEKEYKEWKKRTLVLIGRCIMAPNDNELWRIAYNKGFKAGLEQHPK